MEETIITDEGDDGMRMFFRLGKQEIGATVRNRRPIPFKKDKVAIRVPGLLEIVDVTDGETTEPLRCTEGIRAEIISILDACIAERIGKKNRRE